MLSQDDEPKRHRSAREILPETDIHLDVHRIIHRNLQLKCSRRCALLLSEANRITRLTR